MPTSAAHDLPAALPASTLPASTLTTTAVFASSAAAALAACGGGGGGNESAPITNPPPPVQANPTDAEASRFLGQAAFGATDQELDAVKTNGYSAWLDKQMQMPRTQSHYDWMLANGWGVETSSVSFGGAEATLWRKLISSPDVLRQRVVLALSEIFVVSMVGLPVNWRGFVAANYVDVLEAGAFGTGVTSVSSKTSAGESPHVLR